MIVSSFAVYHAVDCRWDEKGLGRLVVRRTSKSRSLSWLLDGVTRMLYYPYMYAFTSDEYL